MEVITYADIYTRMTGVFLCVSALMIFFAPTGLSGEIESSIDDTEVRHHLLLSTGFTYGLLVDYKLGDGTVDLSKTAFGWMDKKIQESFGLMSIRDASMKYAHSFTMDDRYVRFSPFAPAQIRRQTAKRIGEKEYQIYYWADYAKNQTVVLELKFSVIVLLAMNGQVGAVASLEFYEDGGDTKRFVFIEEREERPFDF